MSRETLLGGVGAWADVDTSGSGYRLMGAAQNDVGTEHQIA